jgi:gamma-glutamyltranspeptidase/glutathione hydrolase
VAAPASLLLAASLLVGCSPAETASRQETASFPGAWELDERVEAEEARRGMVVSADSLASAAGLEALRDGGNAVDAAVAVHFALAVTHPRAGNVGGGGFLVLRGADGHEAALDFREEAPSGAGPDMFLDDEGRVTDESWTGHLASGVPGSVAGMEAAHDRHGELPWGRLLEPAVRLAEEGIPVDSALHADLAEEADRLRRFEASARKWLPGGEPPAVGDTFRQPGLARALRAIADGGSRAFYEGWIADSLASEMERGGGLVDAGDLAAYEPVWRDPVAFRYRGRRVVSMPPPSSGGVTLAEIANMVEGWRLSELGAGSADAVHVAVEAFRRAYADRNFHLGDPDFVDMPLDRLTSQRYADSLRGTIRMDRASPSEAFSKVPAPDSLPEGAQTTHYSVVDSAGRAVAVTTTLNGFFGSAVTVPGAGFFLNNEMDDFTARPGVPNAYGLVQGEANAIRPGKRMLSSMSPTILVGRDGDTRLVTGTPGGATIITTVFRVLSEVVDHGRDVGAAVAAPRVHHQHLPDVVRWEPDGLRPAVVEELERRGHELRVRGGWSGNVQSVGIRDDGVLVGVADPRRGGRALGY